MVASDGSRADFDVQWREYIMWLKEKGIGDPRSALSDMIFSHRWRSTRWVIDIVNQYMEVMVARGKKPVTQGKGSNNGYNTAFVDVSLGGATISDVAAGFGGSDKLASAIQAFCWDGYRVGLSYNAANDAFIASATCRDETSPNYNCTMTAFAGDWVTALQVLLYKHHVVASGNWKAAGGEKPKNTIG